VFRPRRTERRGCGVGRGTARVDVVDEHDARRRAAPRLEAPADVAAPLDQAEPSLARRRPRSRKQIERRKAPAHRELGRERGGGVLRAPEPPVGIGRNRDEGRLGARNRRGDHVGRHRRETAQALLFPRRHQRAGCIGVDDRRARVRECEAASGALVAAAHRPRGRGAAPLAPRRAEDRQRLETARAQLRSADATTDAPFREEEVEHRCIVGA
jgi:hypothetical protein